MNLNAWGAGRNAVGWRSAASHEFDSKSKKNLSNIIYINKGGVSPKNMDGIKTTKGDRAEMLENRKRMAAIDMRMRVFRVYGAREFARIFGMLRYIEEWTMFHHDLPFWMKEQIRDELKSSDSVTEFSCRACGDTITVNQIMNTNDECPMWCCETAWEQFAQGNREWV